MNEVELCKEMLIHCTFNAKRKDLTNNEVINILANFFSLKTIREAKELITNPKPVIKLDDIGQHSFEDINKSWPNYPAPRPLYGPEITYKNEAKPNYQVEMPEVDKSLIIGGE